MLLHWLLLTQHMYEEGFISTPTYPRDDEEPGRSGTLLLFGPKVRFLASQDGQTVKAVYGLHHRKSQIIWMRAIAIWALQCSSNFQQLIQNCLGELNLTYCLIYLCNVVIFSKMEEHLHCPQVVFNWFCEHNFKLKPTKCEFFKSEITYLGHHISKDGVKTKSGQPGGLCRMCTTSDLHWYPILFWT